MCVGMNYHIILCRGLLAYRLISNIPKRLNVRIPLMHHLCELRHVGYMQLLHPPTSTFWLSIVVSINYVQR